MWRSTACALAALAVALPVSMPTAAAQSAEPASQPEAERDHSPEALVRIKAAQEKLGEGFSASVRSYIGDNNNPLLAQLMESSGIWLQQSAGPEQWAARYSGEGKVMGEPEPVGFDIVWTPDRVTWLDHADEALRAEPLGRPVRAGGMAYQVATAPWTQAKGMAQGFAPELEASRLAYEGPGEVEGVRCDIVSVVEKAGAEPLYWYFGVEDSLPRRCEIRLPEASGGGGMRVDFTDVVTGPGTVRPDDWELVAPAGYTERISRVLEARANMQNRPTQRRNPNAEMMPDWEVSDSDGQAVSPAALRDKVTVLYFWGTWSPLCRKSTPEVVKLAQDYEGKPVEVISMAFREGAPEAVLAAAADSGQTWRQVPAADDVVKLLKIRVAPSFIVMGPAGEILLQSGRPAKDDYETLFGEIRTLIDAALSGESGASEAGEPGPTGAGQQVAPGNVSRGRLGNMPTRRAGPGPQKKDDDG